MPNSGQASDPDCVIIGGIAATLYGTTRLTADVDILFDPSPENRERLAQALRTLGARLFEPPGQLRPLDRQRRWWQEQMRDAPRQVDAALLGLFASFHFDTPFGPLDCMTTMPGARPYVDARTRAQPTPMEQFSICVVDLDDLIAMKRATARPKDLQDLNELLEIRRLLEQDATKPAQQQDAD